MDGLTCQDELNLLLAQRQSLMRRIASGIVEVEQPALGRTQYQTTADLAASLRMLDEQIAALAAVCGIATPTATAAKRRRPIYPVVQEW